MNDPQSKQSPLDAMDDIMQHPIEGEQSALDSIAQALRQAASDGDPDSDNSQTSEAELQQRITALEEENAQLRDRALRAAAEAENVRKRAERTQADTSKYAVTNFAKDMVAVFENLLRASASITPESRAANSDVENLAIGVELTQKQLEQVFAKHHITRIDPMGEKFDHNLHQAMMKIDTNDHEAGTIVQVLQAGYVIHDRLLQPAMVGVAKPANNSGADDSQHVDTQA